MIQTSHMLWADVLTTKLIFLDTVHILQIVPVSILCNACSRL
jgi:hypothetical protein